MKKVSIMSTANTVDNLRGVPKFIFLGKKVIEYIVRYYRQPKYLIYYLSKSLRGDYAEPVHFFLDTEFIEKAKTRSTIRLQDGEMGLLLGGRSIYFQSTEPKLIEKLHAAIVNYSDQAPYLIGLPPFIPIPNSVLDEHQFKYLWMPSKILFKLMFNKQAHYFNGCYFYIHKTVIPFLKETSQGRAAIVVSNEENIMAVKKTASQFFSEATTIHYIKTPKTNAFDAYEVLYEKIKLLANESDAVVYMACGPAGKALIYDLSQNENIIAHDIGHGLHFALSGENMEHMIKWGLFKDMFAKYSR